MFVVLTSLFLALSQLAAGAKYQAVRTLNSQRKINITITVDFDNDFVHIMGTGHISNFNGYGFGGTSMANTYAMIKLGNGTFVERKLGNHEAGELLPTTLYGQSVVFTSKASWEVYRALAIDDDRYYNFSVHNFDGSTLNMIWSQGTTSNLEFHGSNNMGTRSLTFARIVTEAPTAFTVGPTFSPTMFPSLPTESPTKFPSESPTPQPSLFPSDGPTLNPSDMPSTPPTLFPSENPSTQPTRNPTGLTDEPTLYPSLSPSFTVEPTTSPSRNPTASPTDVTDSPSQSPTRNPTIAPSAQPSPVPTSSSEQPTMSSEMPTMMPSSMPSAQPSMMPTADLIIDPGNLICFGSVELSSTFMQSANITINVNKSWVLIEAQSVDDGFFMGTGFGNTVMEDTYAIVITGDDMKEERKLGDHFEGQNLTDSFYEYQIIRGDGRVWFGGYRPLVAGDEYSLFGDEEVPDFNQITSVDLNMIWSHGETPYLSFHGENRMGSTQITIRCGDEQDDDDDDDDDGDDDVSGALSNFAAHWTFALLAFLALLV